MTQDYGFTNPNPYDDEAQAFAMFDAIDSKLALASDANLVGIVVSGNAMFVANSGSLPENVGIAWSLAILELCERYATVVNAREDEAAVAQLTYELDQDDVIDAIIADEWNSGGGFDFA